MNILEKIENYLNEGKSMSDLPDDVKKGLESWVADYKSMIKNGNVKGAKQGKSKIDKEIKKLGLNSKEVYGSLNEMKMDYDVYDNQGKTADRWTVVSKEDLKNKQPNGMVDMLGLSENPGSPQGVSMFGQGQVGNHLGKKVKFSSLPKEVQDHISMRYAG